MFKDDHDPSMSRKIILCAGILMGTLIPALLMSVSTHVLLQPLGLEKLKGDSVRQLLIACCSLVYLIRFAICMFVFVKRNIGWIEGGLVSVLWFAMFYLFNKSAGSHSEPIGLIDITGILLYVIGSYFNSRADYQRYIWKRDPENKGRLYTEGLFKYSMHINYFGDSLVYIGIAMLTRDYICLFVSIGIILNFAFLQIPMLDKHLSRKYADEFAEYAKRTKRFIPFVC